jgi:hypothetical protein
MLHFVAEKKWMTTIGLSIVFMLHFVAEKKWMTFLKKKP